MPRKQQRPERTLFLFWDGKAEVGITLRRRSCCCSGFRRMECTRRSQFVSQLFQTTPLGCSLPCVGLRAEGGCAGLSGRRCREMAAGHGLGTGRVRAGHGQDMSTTRAGLGTAERASSATSCCKRSPRERAGYSNSEGYYGKVGLGPLTQE